MFVCTESYHKMVETTTKHDSPNSDLQKSDFSKDSGIKNDWLTVAALGVLAMCVVSFDHEALGHGGACLLLGGHIQLLTSSLFRCDVPSKWIDAGGPAMNLLLGLLALIARTLMPLRFPKIRFFLTLMTAFSFFWEGGYLIHAMHRQDGDLYFFTQSLLGHVTVAERWFGAGLGLALYLATVRLTSRALLTAAPSGKTARATARTAWLAATLGIIIATAAGRWRGLSDAVMEIGLASFPLLIIPRSKRELPGTLSSPAIAHSYPAIALGVIVFIVFVAILGRGI